MSRIFLTHVKILKFKSFENSQQFDVDPQATVLVGLNESGKTSVLEAIAKTNFFQDDADFRFNLASDYPKRELTSIRKSGEDPAALQCSYSLPDELLSLIAADVGEGIFSSKEIVLTHRYSGGTSVSGVSVDIEKFVKVLAANLGFAGQGALIEELKSCTSIDVFEEITNKEEYVDFVDDLKEYREYFNAKGGSNWEDGLSPYIWRTYIKPKLPKFLYYDEYYALPSKFAIEDLMADRLDGEELKTAKALIELANIDLDQLLNTDAWEEFISELEATEASISDTLFKYWTTNKNLEIAFRIQPVEETDARNNTRIVKHVLDIRVKNKRVGVTLSLKNRSKGFNWFFSFLVWFLRIQEDAESTYVLLLDEPGLNLHGAAQNDLLNFIDDLTEEYQVLYTTHSPFMIQPGQLHRVRTLVEEKNGSRISDSVHEKDPNALFPLQAALGYDIAQNLYISPNNLLVEGVSDLVFLKMASECLKAIGRTGLSEAVTIVPVGGADKIASFISLLRGSKLKVVCLLDTPRTQKTLSALDSLSQQKIISEKNVFYFDTFVDFDKADIEDLFGRDEYLRLFNTAFPEHPDISMSQLDLARGQVVDQIAKLIGVPRYNHYRPANLLAKEPNLETYFSESSLEAFEQIFLKVNKLMS